jgi:hypothetical protein
MTLANSLESIHASLEPTRHNRRRYNHRVQADPPLAGWKRTVVDAAAAVGTVVDAVATVAAVVGGEAPGAGGTAEEGARRKASEYIRDLERIAGFMGRCAVGTPTGAHASFKTFAVDAVTLKAVRYENEGQGQGQGEGVGKGDVVSPPVPPVAVAVEGEMALHRLGVLLEGLTRGSNNLLELLHHSVFYYVLVDDDRFLSIAEYIAPQALMLVALLLTAAALAMHGASPSPPSRSGSGGGGGKAAAPPRGRRGGLLWRLLRRFSRGGGKQQQQATVTGAGKGATGRRGGGGVGGGVGGERVVEGQAAAEGPVILHDWSSAFALAAGAYGVGAAAGVTCVAAYDAGASAAQVTAAAGGVAYGGAAVLFDLALGEPRGILSPSSSSSSSASSSASNGESLSLTFSREAPWAALKVVTLSAASTALGALTFFNFALALPVTALLVPACLASGPPSAAAGQEKQHKREQMHAAPASSSAAPSSSASAGGRGRVSAAAATAAAAAGAVLTLAAPCAAAALGALAVGVPPLESLGAFAAHHRAWDGGTFALPLAFGVVWPTATLCAAVTFGALAAAAKTKTKEGHGTVVGDRGGGVEESKKER